MALQCRRLQSREKEPSNFFSLLHPRHLFISFAFLTFERAAFPMAVCVCVPYCSFFSFSVQLDGRIGKQAISHTAKRDEGKEEEIVKPPFYFTRV